MSRTTMPDHFIDALTDDGAHGIPNGGEMQAVENRVTHHRSSFGPVVIKRAPAGDWSCDACGTAGTGWGQIEQHTKRTEHRTYTETRPPR